jgi:hypothetical protein
MFQFVAEQNDTFCAARDSGIAQSLNPRLANFVDWVESSRHVTPATAEGR